MVTSIARQSVIIKSKTGNSILLGNYECAYALGLLSKEAGLEEDDSYTDMRQWHGDVMERVGTYSSQDAQLMEILRITKAYEPQETVDEQMKELYHWGRNEQRMWQL